MNRLGLEGKQELEGGGGCEIVTDIQVKNATSGHTRWRTFYIQEAKATLHNIAQENQLVCKMVLKRRGD